MKRLLSLLLPLLAALTLCSTVWAEEDTAPAIGVDTDGIYGAHGSNLYLGNWKSHPILWRVLSTNGSGGTYTDAQGQPVVQEDAIFLLTANLIETGALDNTRVQPGDPFVFDYLKFSSRNEWCPQFFSDTFNAGEQLAILNTSKAKDGAVVLVESTGLLLTKEKSPALENDKVFIPSAEELCTEAYGFAAAPAAQDRKRDAIPFDKEYARMYFVRSELNYETQGGMMGCILENSGGQVAIAPMAWWLPGFNYFRPATNLNAARIVLNTAVEGGKTETQGLAAVAADGPRDAARKLTLLDDSRSNFSVSTATVTNGTAVFTYENASVGGNEYLSALICDGEGRVLYYGWLEALTDETGTSGTVELDVSGLPLSNGNTLYVFNEQCNGLTYTDYSSPLRPVTLKYPQSENLQPEPSEPETPQPEDPRPETAKSRRLPSQNPQPENTGDNIDSPKTADAGIACYFAAAALTSLWGAAYIATNKRR